MKLLDLLKLGEWSDVYCPDILVIFWVSMASKEDSL